MAQKSGASPALTEIIDEIWRPETSISRAFELLPADTEDRKHIIDVILLRFLPAACFNPEKKPESLTQQQRVSKIEIFIKLVALLKTCDTQTRVVNCMNAMCTMSTCSSHILDLVAADTQTVVVEYARKYADDATILQIAMATLSNLALHKRTAPKLAKAGTIELALETIQKQAKSSSLVECAVTCLANMANTKDATVVATLMSNNVHTTCITLITDNLYHYGVAYHSTLCLSNLSVDVTTHEQLIQADVVGTLTKAILKHLSQPQLVENGLGCFARLTQSGHTSVMTPSPQIEIIISCLCQYPQRNLMQTYACVCLLSILDALKSDKKLHEEALALVRKRHNELSPGFVAACKRGDDHVTNAYIRIVGIDPSTKQVFTTGGPAVAPLEYAILDGSTELLRVLLTNDVEVPTASEMQALALAAIDVQDQDLRFRQLLCLGLVRSYINDKSTVRLHRSRMSALAPPAVPLLVDKRQNATEPIEALSSADMTPSLRQRHRVVQSLPPAPAVAVCQSRRQSNGWFDRSLEKMDDLLLTMVFDPGTGNLIIWKSMLLILAMSTCAGAGMAMILLALDVQFELNLL